MLGASHAALLSAGVASVAADSQNLTFRFASRGALAVVGPTGPIESYDSSRWGFRSARLVPDFLALVLGEKAEDHTRAWGKAFLEAKRTHPNGLLWQAREKKAMLEHIYLGVPWVTAYRFPADAQVAANASW